MPDRHEILTNDFEKLYGFVISGTIYMMCFTITEWCAKKTINCQLKMKKLSSEMEEINTIEKADEWA